MKKKIWLAFTGTVMAIFVLAYTGQKGRYHTKFQEQNSRLEEESSVLSTGEWEINLGLETWKQMEQNIEKTVLIDKERTH